jgi:Yip1 domain
MSDMQVPVIPAAPEAPGLTQMQRVIYTFTAPSKTFNDIKRSSSWWLPFLITTLTGLLLWFAIGTKVTWEQVYENNQRDAPQWAKDMQERQPPEARAQSAKFGPIGQEITWALSPIGLFILNAIGAGVLLVTINFGLGGKAKFFDIFAVEMYAGLVSWVVKFLLGSIAIFAGLPSESFRPQNVAGTNIGYYLSPEETPKALYALATAIDPLVIWTLFLTSIGIAIVAGTKRSSGFIAVFGWWALFTLIIVGVSAF